MPSTQSARIALLTTILFIYVNPSNAAIHLASPFSDNMVIQRDQPVRIRGDSDPNVVIEITLGSDHQSATATPEGRWSVTLAPLKASTEPQTLRAKSNNQETTLSNILIGDLWLCAGQSNMQMTLAETETGPAEVRPAASHKHIRLLTIPKHPAPKPETKFNAKWQECSPETAAKFSAVGYYFGLHLSADPALQSVPIGLIDCSFGGTAAEAWTSSDQLHDFKSTDLLPSMFGIAPGQLYNGMIAPLTPLSMTGVLWYQGESNASKPQLYPRILSSMIADWRTRFDSPNLPFFLVQLPSFTDTHFLWIREAESHVARDVPNVAMAVTIDTNDGYDLHPKQKREIGRRLSLLARQNVYKESLVASGPVFKSALADGANIRVTFDTSGDGLATSAPGAVKGFALAADDGVYRYADATIDGDSVVVHCDAIANPKTVRYAWAGIPEANLKNKSGLPAAPFRTDDLPRELNEVQKQPASHKISTPGYQIAIDGDGKITSLISANKQFISNSPGMAGGSSIPVLFGSRSLASIRALAPNILSCSDNEITLQLTFNSTDTLWQITNRSNSDIQFHLALADRVTAGDYKTPQEPLTLKRQNASITATGFDSLKFTSDGPNLTVTIKPNSTRTLRIAAAQK